MENRVKEHRWQLWHIQHLRPVLRSCISEHTCDNRSAGLTLSTICIQFWNILRSQVSRWRLSLMNISLAIGIDQLVPFFRLFRKLFFKCIQEFVIVRKGVKILEIFVRALAGKDSWKVSRLGRFFCSFHQNPYITGCQVFKNLIQVGRSVEVCSLEVFLLSHALAVQSHAVKFWAVTNLVLTWRRFFSWSTKRSTYSTHLECSACCRLHFSCPGWTTCQGGCGNPQSWTFRWSGKSSQSFIW